MQIRLLVLDDYEGQLSAAPAMERLRRLVDVTILDRPLNAADRSRLADFHLLFALRERTRLDEAFFSACDRLELVLQSGGHAYHLDKDAATRRGIVVALGRRACKPMVVMPELVFSFMLALARQIHPLTTQMVNGDWPESMGSSLAGRTLGILGYGRHGRPVARIAEAFGMKVVAWDRGNAGKTGDQSVERMPLDALLARADFVSIHLRLSDESSGLINRQRLARMKPTAFLINTSRGAIIDEDALVDALANGAIAGAALDVFATEPLPASSPLRRLPNVLLTPHIGWRVADVLHEFVEIAAGQLEAWLAGGLSAEDVLNPNAIDVERTRTGGVSSNTV
ncbi:MAG TPA: NAD(P)-dependent oxidoreductase [Gammaproteobacteria bacterium]